MGSQGKEALWNLLDIEDNIIKEDESQEILILTITILFCSFCVILTLIGLICTIRNRSKVDSVFDAQSQRKTVTNLPLTADE